MRFCLILLVIDLCTATDFIANGYYYQTDYRTERASSGYDHLPQDAHKNSIDVQRLEGRVLHRQFSSSGDITPRNNYEHELYNRRTEECNHQIRSAETDPDAAPMHAEVQGKNAIEWPSPKYMVKCPQGINPRCEDLEHDRGWGYCTEKREYRIFGQLVHPSDCTGCECVEKSGITSNPASPTKKQTGTSKQEHKKSPDKKHQDRRPKKEDLHPRQVEAGPNAELNAALRFGSLGQSLKYAVRCSEDVPVECRDVHYGLPNQGWCDKDGQYKHGIETYPFLECRSCTCLETMTRPQSGISGLAVVKSPDSSKQQEKRQVTEYNKLHPRHSEAEPMWRVRSESSPEARVPFHFLGQSERYVVFCPHGAPAACREVSFGPPAMGYCTEKPKYELASFIEEKRACTGCTCVPRPPSANERGQQNAQGRNSLYPRHPNAGLDAGTMQRNPSIQRSPPTPKSLGSSGSDNPLMSHKYHVVCPSNTAQTCKGTLTTSNTAPSGEGFCTHSGEYKNLNGFYTTRSCREGGCTCAENDPPGLRSQLVRGQQAGGSMHGSSVHGQILDSQSMQGSSVHGQVFHDPSTHGQSMHSQPSEYGSAHSQFPADQSQRAGHETSLTFGNRRGSSTPDFQGLSSANLGTGAEGKAGQEKDRSRRGGGCLPMLGKLCGKKEKKKKKKKKKKD